MKGKRKILAIATCISVYSALAGSVIFQFSVFNSLSISVYVYMHFQKQIFSLGNSQHFEVMEKMLWSFNLNLEVMWYDWKTKKEESKLVITFNPCSKDI